MFAFLQLALLQHIAAALRPIRTQPPSLAQLHLPQALSELARLRAHTRNAALLLDLENCDAGYSPTRWQRDRLPAIFHDKVRVIFDGIDTDVFAPTPGRMRFTIRSFTRRGLLPPLSSRIFSTSSPGPG